MDRRRALRLWKLLLVVALLLLPLRLLWAIDVPLKHPVYPFLERADISGLLERSLHGARPFSRVQVARLLVEIDRQRNALSRVQRARLDRYLFEFADDLRYGAQQPVLADSLTGRSSIEQLRWQRRGELPLLRELGLYRNPRNLYTVQDEHFQLAFQPHLELSVDGSAGGVDGATHSTATGLLVRGYYHRFGLGAVSRDAVIEGDIEIQPAQRYPLRFRDELKSRQAGRIEYDETDAMLSWGDRRASLLFGKTSAAWGEGAVGSPALSGNAQPFTQLRYRFDAGPLSLTGLHGKLQQHPLPVDSSVTPVEAIYLRKWMAGHRYQLDFVRWLRIGLYDLIVYGDRELDWDYLPPLTFLWSTEHYNRDRDNVQLGIDFRILPGWRSEIYGQWHLDELRFSDQFSDWWGNKHAYLIGLRQIDLLGLPNSDAALEYVLVRPYVYTHHRSVNVFQHYGANLGHPIGPNSDQLLLRWRQQLSAWASLDIRVRQMRHGANPPGRNVGGDVRQPHAWTDAEQAPFLGGDLQTVQELSLAAELELSFALLLRLEGSVGRQISEPASGGRSVQALRSGSISLLWHPWRWGR